MPSVEGITKLMTIKLTYFVVIWLNAFLVKSGISMKFSPTELIQRYKLSAKLHCKNFLDHTVKSMTNLTHLTACKDTHMKPYAWDQLEMLKGVTNFTAS